MALQQPAGLTHPALRSGELRTQAARVLDAVAMVLLVFTALLIVTGGVRLGGVRLERAEDALVATTAASSAAAVSSASRRALPAQSLAARHQPA